MSIRSIARDDRQLWQGECPQCGQWADLDDDQFHARVSSECPNCGWHDTKNWSTETIVRGS